MTEIPEHLLKGAQAVREQAARDIPGHPGYVPPHLLERLQAAKAKVMQDELTRSRSEMRRQEVQGSAAVNDPSDIDQIMRDHIRGIEIENRDYKDRMKMIIDILDRAQEKGTDSLDEYMSKAFTSVRHIASL